MYIIRLTLIFLLTFFSFSCLKNSSKTSSYGSAASIQYYGFAMLKSNNNYICMFKCSFLSARGCQGYYIETSKSGLDEQTLNMIKGTSSDSEDPNKYDTLLNTAKSLIDLATKKRLTSGYCSIASYYERGSWPHKASLLTVKASIPSKYLFSLKSILRLSIMLKASSSEISFFDVEEINLAFFSFMKNITVIVFSSYISCSFLIKLLNFSVNLVYVSSFLCFSLT